MIVKFDDKGHPHCWKCCPHLDCGRSDGCVDTLEVKCFHDAHEQNTHRLHQGNVRNLLPSNADYAHVLEHCLQIAVERGEKYGTSKENFGDIQTILANTFDLILSKEAIVKVMIATKLSREKHAHNPDNLKDLVNYCAILAHFYDGKNTPK